MRKTCYNHAVTIHLTTRKDRAFFLGGSEGVRGLLVGWSVGWVGLDLFVCLMQDFEVTRN